MSETTAAIKLGDREITLVGTAHVSRESIDEVKKTIEDKKPDMVCVELDSTRYASISQKDNWEKLDIVKVFREGKGFLLMANLVLAGFQRRLGDELGVKPGEEMKAAVEKAEELGVPFSFCDREVQVTLRRAWSKCGLWNKAKLLASLISSAFTTEKLSTEEIENLKKRSELDGMMNELARYLPPVKETLIDERDRFLAAKIWSSGGKNSIAVVGAGHMEGIKAHLDAIASGGESDNVDDINVIPPPGIVSKIMPWLIPALIVGLIGYGMYVISIKVGFKQGLKEGLWLALKWCLWNGGFAALGTLLALGHPLAILVGFFGAPIATASPVLGVGMFTGITQAFVRKPRVEDAETINEAIGSLRGIYRNRITHALLVFFLSAIGGVVGNVKAIQTIVGHVVK
jgi:pheromone shutdown-related protein TraB